MSVIIKLLSKFDDSGLRKAKSGFSGLSKTLGAVGIGFGLKAVTDTLMDAAKAASADEKSTKLLNIQLERNAGATKEQLKQNSKFIESLSLETGIMDDDLRPSMAKFGNVTKNVKDAQRLLKITIDATAGSGKSQTKIANAVAKAYGGNTKALQGMFPELKKSKDVLGDFAKTYEGMAAANADPFMKFNNSMDILKEKLGVIVLPLVEDAIAKMSEPGGLIETVGQFFEDVANPKTDISKAFKLFGETVATAGQNLGAFFAMMDPKNEGNAMAGFASALTWISITLGTITDGLLVLSTAMQKTFSGDFNGAIALMNAETSIGAMAIRNNMGVKETIDEINAKTMKTGSGLIVTGTTGGVGDRKENVIFGSPNAKLPKNPMVFRPGATTNNVTINVVNADPKATVNTLNKYLKQNGSLPLPGVKKTP
jgi:hypothetical protein